MMGGLGGKFANSWREGGAVPFNRASLMSSVASALLNRAKSAMQPLHLSTVGWKQCVKP